MEMDGGGSKKVVGSPQGKNPVAHHPGSIPWENPGLSPKKISVRSIILLLFF